MVPRVQTFAWSILRKALPTGLRAARFSTHITEFCCRCGQQENDIHLFFLCDFARAAWFGHPWYIEFDVLVQNHFNIHDIILALLNMNHPHASIFNIFNFMWSIWKARNDCLFDRKNHLPHHINIATRALSNEQCDITNKSDQNQVQHQAYSSAPCNQLPKQGHTLKSDLLITGPKVFSDAAFKCKKIPGLPQGAAATGVGLFLCFFRTKLK